MDQPRPKQANDPYAQRAKTLASHVQRLRGWVGSDPGRTPELADALVALTAHRLAGHGYAAAAADAQESVRLAATVLTANGPIGPYTSLDDAVRYVTAIVHLATIQSGVGLAAAAETVGSVADLRRQVAGVDQRLSPQTAIWALTCLARGALQAGDLATANSHADAARARLDESGLRADPDASYLVLDVDALLGDCRWAAGWPGEALAWLHLARVRYDAEVDGRLDEPRRLSPVLLQRLAEPLFGRYQTLADRLAAVGEADLGLQVRRELVATLDRLDGRVETVAEQLAAARGALVADLELAGRSAEAGLRVAEAPEEPRRLEVPNPQPPVAWTALDPVDAFVATTGSSAAAPVPPVDAAAAWASYAAWAGGGRPAATQREAELARQAAAEFERRAAQHAEAERAAAERAAAERAEAERSAAAEAARQAAAEEAERLERKRRREERIEEHRLEAERRDAERREAERLAAERQASAE